MSLITYNPNVNYWYYKENTYKPDPNNFTQKEFNRTPFVLKGAAFLGTTALVIGELPRIVGQCYKPFVKDKKKITEIEQRMDKIAFAKGKWRIIAPVAAALIGGGLNLFTSENKAVTTWDSLEKHEDYVDDLKEKYILLPWIFEGLMIKKPNSEDE